MSIKNLLTSSLGKKYVMGITGLAMFIFVALHLVGNLQIFLGPESINRYGAFLQGNLELIWPARIGLVTIVFLHVWAAIQLSAANRAARPQPYAHHEVVAASYASKTMLMSGLIIAAFIVYHLLHFTVQVKELNLTGVDFTKLEDSKKQHDVFAMIVTGFRNPVVSIAYIIAMSLLCLHLSHGVSALFQSLGWKSPAYAPIINKFAMIASWLIFLGYISIPVSILLGYGSDYLSLHK